MNPSAPFDFRGRHLFVAGGSSGINFGVAEGFARAGANVSLMSRSLDRITAAASRLVALGADAIGLAGDVRDPAAVQKALDAAVERFGPIDVLLNGAAGNFLAKINDMSPNAFKSVVDIDLLGSFNVARLAYGHLRKPGASIIHISTTQAFTPTPYQAHVCAAKAAVDMLSRVMAAEWGADGIRVNSIMPGPIADTEGLNRLVPTPQGRDAMAQRVPLKRLGRTSDIAHAAMFLASEWGDFITGAVIPVDGGLGLTGPRDFTAAGEASKQARVAAGSGA
ncbi:SDR family oxidoreductase [Ramlibacter sp.]|uniref:SDR family oxidoreductase n=1 Tax=Ramlibacter sp. TaxID=1917967 RepID=UPI003D09B9DF